MCNLKIVVFIGNYWYKKVVDTLILLWYNIGVFGDALVSTGIIEHKWQVELFTLQTKLNITGNSIKTAFANLFNRNTELAFA